MGYKSRNLSDLILSAPIGVAGGAACGAALMLISGAFYPSFHAASSADVPVVASVGAIYGAVIGGLIMPVAYLVVLYRTGFKKALPPLTIGTIAGGVCGFAVSLDTAMVTGCIGFSLACMYLLLKAREHR